MIACIVLLVLRSIIRNINYRIRDASFPVVTVFTDLDFREKLVVADILFELGECHSSIL